MDEGVFWHLKPELVELLVAAIPLLTRGKPACLNVFRSAGVPAVMTNDLSEQLTKDSNSIGKQHIARTVLTRLNEAGDKPEAIKWRREIVRRVVEWEDLTTCYPDNVMKARGAVAAIRSVVNRQDAFTEMKNAKEAQDAKQRAENQAKAEAVARDKQELESIKNDFYALYSMADAQKRGRMLEGVLNRLFKHFKILIRESFTIRSNETGKPLEQIDGVVVIDHIAYLVEMKWWDEPIGVPEIQQHVARIILRMSHGTIRGIVISHEGYTGSAVMTAREARPAGATIMLCTTKDIFDLLEQQGDLLAFLRSRIEIATVDKQPFPSA